MWPLQHADGTAIVPGRPSLRIKGRCRKHHHWDADAILLWKSSGCKHHSSYIHPHLITETKPKPQFHTVRFHECPGGTSLCGSCLSCKGMALSPFVAKVCQAWLAWKQVQHPPRLQPVSVNRWPEDHLTSTDQEHLPDSNLSNYDKMFKHEPISNYRSSLESSKPRAVEDMTECDSTIFNKSCLQRAKLKATAPIPMLRLQSPEIPPGSKDQSDHWTTDGFQASCFKRLPARTNAGPKVRSTCAKYSNIFKCSWVNENNEPSTWNGWLPDQLCDPNGQYAFQHAILIRVRRH